MMNDGSIKSSILDAAESVLGSVGYLKATTNLIAKRAGVSIGSLYYYFRSKDAVYRKLTDEVMTSYIKRLEQILENEKDSKKVKEALVIETVDFTFANRDLLRKLFSQAPKLGRMEAVYDFRNTFARTLAERFKLKGEDTFVLVNAINGVLDNYIFSSDCTLTREQMKAALIRLGV